MAIGRVYTGIIANAAQTAQIDFFEIVAPADACVELMEIHLSQVTEVGDAAEEMLLVSLLSGQTTSGSGGTAPTAVPLSLGDAAFGGTIEVNNTTKATSGTIVTHAVWNWNIRMPLDVIFTPETCKILSPSARMTLTLGTTPADSTTFGGYFVFKEIGG